MVSGYLSGQSTEDRAHLLRFRLLHTVTAVLAVSVLDELRRRSAVLERQHELQQRPDVCVLRAAAQRSVREHRAEAQQTSLLAHYAE